jgi:hypothetical protein
MSQNCVQINLFSTRTVNAMRFGRLVSLKSLIAKIRDLIVEKNRKKFAIFESYFISAFLQIKRNIIMRPINQSPGLSFFAHSQNMCVNDSAWVRKKCFIFGFDSYFST